MSSDSDQQSPTHEELQSAIKRILGAENLEKLSAKRVRQQLSEEFNTDLTDRKAELDDMIMKCVEEHAAKNGEAPKPKAEKRKSGAQASASKKTRAASDSGSEISDGESATKKKKGNKKGQSIYSMELILSEDLAGIMGVDKMARKDVVKRMWQIFKERDLLDPNNRQFVIPDPELAKVFGKERFRAFGLMKHLKNHLTDPRHV